MRKSDHHRDERKKTMTDEERLARLQEMMQNKDDMDNDRKRRLDKLDRSKEHEDVKYNGKFLNSLSKASVDVDKSLEDRLNRRRYHRSK